MQGRSPGEGNGNPLQYSGLEIPWREELGGLQSMASQEVRHNLVTKQQQQIRVKFPPALAFWALNGSALFGHMVPQKKKSIFVHFFKFNAILFKLPITLQNRLCSCIECKETEVHYLVILYTIFNPSKSKSRAQSPLSPPFTNIGDQHLSILGNGPENWKSKKKVLYFLWFTVLAMDEYYKETIKE